MINLLNNYFSKILLKAVFIFGLLLTYSLAFAKNSGKNISKKFLKEIVIYPHQSFEDSNRYKKFIRKLLNRPIPLNFTKNITNDIGKLFFKDGQSKEILVKTEFKPLEKIVSQGFIKEFVSCNILIKPKDQLKFGKIFLGDRNSSSRISLSDYQEKFSGPDICKMLCFKEGEPWSWAAVDQSIKNLQECTLFKAAKINVLPELGTCTDCPVEIFLEENFDKQYRLRIGGEMHHNSIDKYLMLDYDAFNYKIRNSIFNVGMDLRDRSTKFKIQYEIPTTIFMPINFLFFVNSQFDRPDKKLPLSLYGEVGLESFCRSCLAKKVAENTLLSSTKVGVSIEPRLTLFGHKIFYNIIFDRQCFDLKDLGERNFMQQFVFRRQNIDNGWSNRTGTNFCFKATVAASKNQVVSEFCVNQALFFPITNTSTLALLLDFSFGTKSNFFDSFKQLCKNAANLIYPKPALVEKESAFCDSCYDQKFKNMFPPVTDRIKYENCICEPSFLYCDGLLRSDLMLQFRKKFSNTFSGVLFHTFFYSQGTDFYNSSGLGLRYNSTFGTFCLDFSLKWYGDVSMDKKLAWRFTFGESF